MPKPPAMKTPVVKSWSFTRYDDYSKCPLFFKLKNLDKLPEPKSPAMLRGADIAKASEDYLLKRTSKLDLNLKTFAEEYKFYRTQPNIIVEASWGFTRDWNACSPTDWNNCWGRAKIDIGYVDLQDNELHIRDGKTGKFREHDAAKYMMQLELYSAVGIIMYPTVRKVIPRLNYTDLGITYPDGVKVPDVEYTAKEAVALQKVWNKRVVPMFNDRQFAPRPGKHCGYCPYSKEKGGPCKF